MAIHVQTWTGTGSARLTDMTDAHKRGKTCRIFCFQGWNPGQSNDPTAQRCNQLCLDVRLFLEHQDPTASFDDVARRVREMVAAENLPTGLASTYEETIRAIDAPRPKLRAGVPGVWSAEADEGGIGVSDLSDQFNWPRSITHKQTGQQAYKLAAKAWHKLNECKNHHEADNVLTAAGCRLHYYCAMD